MEKVKKELSKRGKSSRARGQRFELKVRQDLEKKGWVVSKWMNTIEYEKEEGIGKIVPAKRKYNPFMRAMAIGTGFPDFICFKGMDENDEETIEGTLIPEVYREKKKKIFDVIGVEVKGNGYLDPKEKGMCIWLIENRIFSKILIAKRGKKAGKIEYINFEKKYNKQ